MYHDIYYRGYFITSYFGAIDLTGYEVLVFAGIDLASYDFTDFKVIPGCFCY